VRLVSSQQSSNVATGSEHSELVVLTLLLDGETPWLWSLEELARELGDEPRAADAVASLHGAGLVHRCQQFIFATYAAVRFSRLLGGI
jgi:hypothetical protein